MKYDKILIIYDSPPSPPEGVYLGRNYSIIKKYSKFYITDGNAEIEMEIDLIKMLFKPMDISWGEVSFKDEEEKTFKKFNVS